MSMRCTVAGTDSAAPTAASASVLTSESCLSSTVTPSTLARASPSAPSDGRVLGPMRIVTRARSVVTSRSSGGTLAGS